MRDSIKRRKSAVLRVRLTEEEQESFARFCADAGLTQSEAMRRLVRAATGLGPTFEGDACAEIVALTRQLRALGTNLNQAVRHMNAGHVIAGSEVAEWLSAAQGLIKELTAHYDSLCSRAPPRHSRLARPPDRRVRVSRDRRPLILIAAPQPTPENPACAERLMEEVCARENLVKAWKRVRSNKGGAGVDAVTIDDAKAHLRERWPNIRSQLLEGSYQPLPVKRVEIPKPDGGVRKLGVPTRWA